MNQEFKIQKIILAAFVFIITGNPDAGFAQDADVAAPLVSYQYYESVGDDVLSSQASPAVSYFFGGGLALSVNGSVKDSSGLPVAGAIVTIRRNNTEFWKGSTSADGTFWSAAIPAGMFNIDIVKAGYGSILGSVQGSDGGSVTLDYTLSPGLEIPVVIAGDRIPEQDVMDQFNEELSGLKIFNGSAFTSDHPLYKERMTIVITHGWNKSEVDGIPSWITDFGRLIYSNHRFGSEHPNIIAWDWSGPAKGRVPPVAQANFQGELLGKALYFSLSANYRMPIHFIGHSLGTVVNSYACDYVHGALPAPGNDLDPGWDRDFTRPHVTLLDDAEIVSVGGQKIAPFSKILSDDFRRRYGIFQDLAVDPEDWRRVVPISSWWTDSYVSLTGRIHQNAVTVVLPAVARSGTWSLAEEISKLERAHQYAHEWYRQSVQSSGAFPQIGFRSSHEKLPDFPPVGPGTSRGSVWFENTLSAEPLDLTLETDLSVASKVANIGSSLYLRAGARTAITTGLDSYVTGIEMFGDIGGDAILITGDVLASVGENLVNAYDSVRDKLSSIDPDIAFVGSIMNQGLVLKLKTDSASPRGSRDLAQAPQAWFPVEVPANAGFLVFDFSVSGDPGDDVIVCSVNNNNVFALPARLVPGETIVSTDLLDITAHSGETVELYFGMIGGTSSGCTLTVQGVRFITLPEPWLGVSSTDEHVRLEWPAAAAGWIPQRSSTLENGGWLDIEPEGQWINEDGIMSLQLPRLREEEFFRLKLRE